MKHDTDITILTDSRYVAPKEKNSYVANILHEEQLVQEALEEEGLRVERINWDHEGMDWTKTRFILFRSTWDYFERFPEFWSWLNDVRHQTAMINPYEMIRWNLDKHYLGDLKDQGTPIPATRFIEKGEDRTLESCIEGTGWVEVILKPVVSGAARHTYRFARERAFSYESVFRDLIRQEALMVQEFQHQVLTKGEVALMVLGGQFTHAILKKAKKGDFRVQDDFGGTVTLYKPTPQEIRFAEKVVARCNPQPVYARVDAIWDNQDRLVLSELELIEPELWFRFSPDAAGQMAKAIVNHMKDTSIHQS